MTIDRMKWMLGNLIFNIENNDITKAEILIALKRMKEYCEE